MTDLTIAQDEGPVTLDVTTSMRPTWKFGGRPGGALGLETGTTRCTVDMTGDQARQLAALLLEEAGTGRTGRKETL